MCFEHISRHVHDLGQFPKEGIMVYHKICFLEKGLFDISTDCYRSNRRDSLLELLESLDTNVFYLMDRGVEEGSSQTYRVLSDNSRSNFYL